MIFENKKYKIAVACIELMFGIPVLGGLLIIANLWFPLIVLLGFHIYGLAMASNTGKEQTGHIIGIVCNIVGIIPFVGMAMHLFTGVMLLIEGIKDK